jgi:hypothetical protein
VIDIISEYIAAPVCVLEVGTEIEAKVNIYTNNNCNA